MTDVLDFLPVFGETLARVRARMDADANAGLAPTDPAYIDTREGSFYWDMTQVTALEIARLWDAIGSEAVAAAFPSVAWGEYLDEHAATFGLVRNPAVSASGIETFEGTPGTIIATGTEVSADPSDPSLDTIVFRVTGPGGTIPPLGSIDLPVLATTSGTVGNLSGGAITNLETAVNGITSVTNAAPTTGGVDVEDDDALRRRVLAQYAGQGAGTVNWYVQEALSYPGVERAVCIPVWDGPGTVLVVPMLADGSPVSPAIVSALQVGDAVYPGLDPIPGQGHGRAPVGATVTVATTVAKVIGIIGQVDHEPGFSLDGTGGTIATRVAIVTALSAYLMSLSPGDTVGYQEIIGAFMSVTGVLRVNSLTVNGGTADVALSDSPPQYAEMATPTLT